MAKASDWLRFSGSKGEPTAREEKITLLVFIIVVGFSAATVYHYIMGHYLGKPWPLNSFLYLPQSRFFDFTLVVRQSATLDPFVKDIGGFAGAPFPQLVGYLFSLVHPVILRFVVFFGSFLVVLILMVKHYLYGLKSRLTLQQMLPISAIVFLTYPVLFAVDRGNFDLIVCALLLLFAFLYMRQQYKASAVFLSLAIATKPYAAILVMIFVFNKKYREALLALCGAVLLSVFSLSLFKDGLFVEACKYLKALSGMASYLSAGGQQSYTSDLFGSLTALVRFVGDALNIDRSGTTMYLPAHPVASICYAVLAVTVSLYFMIYLWNRAQPSWKIMAVLTILLILLPYNSGDYRLTYLFAPMLMYMSVAERTRRDVWIVVLWGLLLVPKNYYLLHLAPSHYYSFEVYQTVGMVINPLLLIAMLVCILPGAFSPNGVASTLHFAYTRLLSTVRTTTSRQNA